MKKHDSAATPLHLVRTPLPPPQQSSSQARAAAKPSPSSNRGSINESCRSKGSSSALSHSDVSHLPNNSDWEEKTRAFAARSLSEVKDGDERQSLSVPRHVGAGM